MPIIEYYLKEEQSQNFIWISVGIISFLTSLLFLFLIKYSFFKGMAVPLAIIGLMQLTTGIMNYSNSAKDKLQWQMLMKTESNTSKICELIKTENAKPSHTIYRWIEIACIIIGMILYILYKKSSQPFWKGFGLALVIQGFTLLLLNEIAHARAEFYLKSVGCF